MRLDGISRWANLSREDRMLWWYDYHRNSYKSFFIAITVRIKAF